MMEYCEMIAVYKCTECGHLVPCEEWEQPDDECPFCEFCDAQKKAVEEINNETKKVEV